MIFRDRGKKKNNYFFRIILIILILLPLVYLVSAVVKYKVDVPFWDQWNFVPLLGKSLEGEITLEDLWGLHNEHRLFFPRLIMLGLAHLSGYNISYELAFNILLAVGIFSLVLLRIKKILRSLDIRGFPWIVPVLSLLAFSLNQGENWVWGWQIQIFLNVLAVVAGLFLLTGSEFKWTRFSGALFCGIIATYSFAMGSPIGPLDFSLFCLFPS